jgi:hypothetical protein
VNSALLRIGSNTYSEGAAIESILKRLEEDHPTQVRLTGTTLSSATDSPKDTILPAGNQRCRGRPLILGKSRVRTKR